ncbi:MAG: S8 family serine peptidase [Thermoleophilaceae bacterium]|nr:S8 family serine peptidase [Thermoleophilaceae bacterium]
MARTELVSGSTRTWQDSTFRFALLVAALAIFACMLPVAASADEDDGPDFSTYLTIKFVDGTTPAERRSLRKSAGVQYEVSLDSPLLQQATVPDGKSPAVVADKLASYPAVEFAVASGEYRPDDLPNPYYNDNFLDKQWALNNYGQVFMSRLNGSVFENVSGTPDADINAPEAWNQITPGDLAEVKLGVIDTGVAYEHPDLAANMVPGKDFYDADDDPRDINGHGTHVASVVAGVQNNAIGTVGVDPWAKVMPLRAADEYGSFSWAAIEQAVAHGLANGVRVFNGSFSGPDNDPAFELLIAENPQALFVFSSGNGGGDQVGDNHDSASGLDHRYPCDTNLPNVICVGSSNWNDALSGFSDYGVNSVDLLAPGSSIYAAKPCTVPAPDVDHQTECPYDAIDETAPVGLGGGPYAFQLLSGTSMAAPAVAGTAALLWSKCPTLQTSQIKSAIVGTVKPIAAVRTKVAYGGRLDAAAAVSSIGSCPAPSDGTDWPVPPEQPVQPDPDGGSTGSTGTVPPSSDGGNLPPKGGSTIKPLTFQIIRPLKSRVGRTNKVKFRIRCSDVCSAVAVFRPISSGVTFKAFKGKLKRSKGAGTRTLTVRVPRATLRAMRAMLAARSRVRLKISVIVTDKAAQSSKPVVFNVALSK